MRKRSSRRRSATPASCSRTCRFLNRPGIVGWWVNGRLLRRRVLPAGQLAAFKLLLPLLKREEANPPSIGMSLLAIGRKPA